MSDPRPGVPSPAGSRDSDDSLRDAGVKLLARLSAVIRSVNVYDVENQTFIQQLSLFSDALQPVLERFGDATLVTLDTDLYLNGVRVPIKSANFGFVKHVVFELQLREIAGIRVTQGVSREELQEFFRLFKDPKKYRAVDLLMACLERGSGDVMPVIEASVEEFEDDADGDGASRGNSARRSLGPMPTDWDSGQGGSSPAVRRSPSRGGGPDGGTNRVGGAGGDSGISGDGSGEGAERATAPGDTAAAPEPAHGSPSGGTHQGHHQADACVSWDGYRSARKRLKTGVQGARWLLTSTSIHGGIQLRHAKRVVQPLVDATFEEEPLVAGLPSLFHRDSYTYSHAVNVCILAVTMGKYLRMDRRALADLGVASLLHDVGKSAVSRPNSSGVMVAAPQTPIPIERHPIEGAKLLARSTSLNLTTVRCMRVALEHHRNLDGTGYPERVGSRPPSVMSRVIAVADCYASLQARTDSQGNLVTPYQALQMMLGPMKPAFDQAALWALVQAVGHYPPGQVVELDDHSLALVLTPNPRDLSRPNVRIIVPPPGGSTRPGEGSELGPLPPGRAVLRPLPPEEYPRGDPWPTDDPADDGSNRIEGTAADGGAQAA